MGTVTRTDALLPSQVAVTIAAPLATAVTSPAPDTVAIAGSLELHVTTRVVMTAPVESRTVAVIGLVLPTAREMDVGVTVTVATADGGGRATETVVLPICPSLVATISADPAATAVTTPEEETVTIAALVELQEIPRPVSGCPVESRGMAVACVD